MERFPHSTIQLLSLQRYLAPRRGPAPDVGPVWRTLLLYLCYQELPNKEVCLGTSDLQLEDSILNYILFQLLPDVACHLLGARSFMILELRCGLVHDVNSLTTQRLVFSLESLIA